MSSWRQVYTGRFMVSSKQSIRVGSTFHVLPTPALINVDSHILDSVYRWRASEQNMQWRPYDEFQLYACVDRFDRGRLSRVGRDRAYPTRAGRHRNHAVQNSSSRRCVDRFETAVVASALCR